MRRLVAGVAILVFTGSLLAYLWWGRHSYDHDLLLVLTYVTCLLAVGFSHWYFGDTIGRLGLLPGNWRKSILSFGLLTLAGSALIVGIAILSGHTAGRVEGLWTYPLWAGLQQYLLQNFLRLRFEGLFRPATEGSPGTARSSRISLADLFAAAAAAGVFGLLHWPNHTLALLSLAAGFFWCLLFRWTPNFYAAWGSHVILGLLLASFFKQAGIGGLVVGKPGFRFESYGDGVQVAAGRDAESRPLVATLPGPDRGHPSLVRIFQPSGQIRSEWVAFPEFDFSARFAVGDLGFGPGDELAAVPGPAPENPPLVRVFTLDGALLSEFNAAALPPEYGASISIQCGQVYLGAGPGPLQPLLAASYSPRGELTGEWHFEGIEDLRNGIGCLPLPLDCRDRRPGSLLLWGSSISVNPSDLLFWSPSGVARRETFPTTYGLNVAAVTLDRRHFIATAPGPLAGYPPWIRVFRENEPWELVRDFVPFSDPGSAGANLAAVDVDGDGRDELIVGEGCAPGRPPVVRLVTIDGEVLDEWRAYD